MTHLQMRIFHLCTGDCEEKVLEVFCETLIEYDICDVTKKESKESRESDDRMTILALE